MRIPKLREIGRKGVPIQKKDMIRVDFSDRSIHSIVKVNQTCVLRVRWFVKRVVSCDPWVIIIVFSQLLPKPDGTILEVSMIPERSIVSWVI